jgi:hypothetical protein
VGENPTRRQDDGKRDYSGLYDLDAMSAAIASFYSM